MGMRPIITITDFELIEHDGQLGLLLNEALAKKQYRHAYFPRTSFFDLILDAGSHLLRFSGIAPPLFGRLIKSSRLLVFEYREKGLRSQAIPIREVVDEG